MPTNGTIDNIQIQINASANSAANSIDQLAKQLTALRNVVKGGTASFSNVAKGITEIGTASSKIKTNAINKIDALVRTLSYMRSISAPKGVGAELDRIADSVGKFNKRNMDRLREVISILKELKNVGNVNLSIRIDDKGVKTSAKAVQQSVKKAVETAKISEAPAEMREIAETASKASKVGAVSAEMKEIAEAANEASEATSNGMKKSAKEIKEAQKRAENFKKILKDIALSFTAGLFGKDIFGNFLKNLNAKGISSFLGSSIRKSVTTPISLAMSGIQKMKPAISSVFGLLGKGMSKFMSLSAIPLKLFTAPIRSIGNSLIGITKRITGLYNSLKRVAMYRLLRTAIKMFTQGLKEGTQNLYQYSSVMGTEFKRSMDQMATAALYMKNSLATIAEPIVNVLAPAIDRLSDKFAVLADKVAHFVAALTGQATYSRALKFPKEYADAANKAAKATQKWLAPFDEINRLSDSNANANADADDFRKMFETVKVTGEGWIADIVKKIKEAWKEGDFTEVGAILANKIKNALDNIPWDGIQKSAKKVGKSIGTFINGFFGDSEFTTSVGNAIAQGINTGIKFFETLKDTLDFATLGNALGAGINGFLNKFDFDGFVGSIVGFGQGFVTYLANAAATVKWDALGTKIGTAIKNIKWGEVFLGISNLGRTVITGFATAVTNFVNTGALGSLFDGVATGVADLLGDAEMWKKAFTTAKGVGIAFKDGLITVLKGAVKGIGKALGVVTIGDLTVDLPNLAKEIAEKIAKALGNINWTKIKEKATTVGSTIGSTITSFFTAEGFASSIGESIANGINSGISFFAGLKDKLNFEKLGESLGQGLQTFLDTFDFDTFVGTVVGFGTGIVSFLANAIGTVKWDDFGEKVGKAIKAIDWKVAFGKVKELGKATVKALLEFIIGVTENGSLDDMFYEFGKKVGEILADKELWEKAFKAVTGIGSAIIQGLVGVISGATGIDISISSENAGNIATILLGALGIKKIGGLFNFGSAIQTVFTSGVKEATASSFATVGEVITEEMVKTGIGGGAILSKVATGLAATIPIAITITGIIAAIKLEKEGKLEETLKEYDNEYGWIYQTPATNPENYGKTVHTGGGTGVEDDFIERNKLLAQAEKESTFLNKIYESADKSKNALNEFYNVFPNGTKKALAANLSLEKSSAQLNQNMMKDIHAIDAGLDEIDKSRATLKKNFSSKNPIGETGFGAASNAIQNGAKAATNGILAIGTGTANLKKALTAKNPIGETGFAAASTTLQNSAKGAKTAIDTTKTGVTNLKNTLTAKNPIGEVGFGAATTTIGNSAKNAKTAIDTLKTGVANAKTAITAKNALGQTAFSTATGSIEKAAKNSAKGVGGAMVNMARDIKNAVANSDTNLSTLAKKSVEYANEIARSYKSIAMQSTTERAATIKAGTYSDTITRYTSAYASGGFVDSGEFFLAREAGPELVGRIGNRTAVANNDQIVAGIAAGVEDANAGVINAVYAVANQIIGAIRENKSGAVDWDAVSRKITLAQHRQAVAANI